MRYQIGLSLLLLGASALHAAQFSQFSFTYTGTIFGGGSVNASGTLTAMNMGSGVYQVTRISGERDNNTQTITGLAPGDLSLLYTGAGGIFGLTTSGGMVAFDLKGVSGYDSFEYVSGLGYEETMFNSHNVMTSTATLTSFKITAMPEPSTLLIFLTLGVLVWMLGQKLPIRSVRKP